MGLMDSIKNKYKATGLTDELCTHLNQCGLKARVVEAEGSEGLQHSFSLRLDNLPAGCVKVEGCNIDFVEMHREIKESNTSIKILDVGITPPKIAYDYTAVARVDVGDDDKDLRAKVDYIKKGLIKKEIIDFRWKGGLLAERLNNDLELTSMVKAVGIPYLEISPNKKDGYVQIERERESEGLFDVSVGKYGFPDTKTLAVYDRILGIVRSMRPDQKG